MASGGSFNEEQFTQEAHALLKVFQLFGLAIFLFRVCLSCFNGLNLSRIFLSRVVVWFQQFQGWTIRDFKRVSKRQHYCVDCRAWRWQNGCRLDVAAVGAAPLGIVQKNSFVCASVGCCEGQFHSFYKRFNYKLAKKYIYYFLFLLGRLCFSKQMHQMLHQKCLLLAKQRSLRMRLTTIIRTLLPSSSNWIGDTFVALLKIPNNFFVVLRLMLMEQNCGNICRAMHVLSCQALSLTKLTCAGSGESTSDQAVTILQSCATSMSQFC